MQGRLFARLYMTNNITQENKNTEFKDRYKEGNKYVILGCNFLYCPPLIEGIYRRQGFECYSSCLEVKIIVSPYHTLSIGWSLFYKALRFWYWENAVILLSVYRSAFCNSVTAMPGTDFVAGVYRTGDVAMAIFWICIAFLSIESSSCKTLYNYWSRNCTRARVITQMTVTPIFG